ncbi:MAG: hypothetical protein MUP09_02545 [Thiovulaceae bacterium]|nr:hypothetical protein [Sulfurimonadaceae bacterium]
MAFYIDSPTIGIDTNPVLINTALLLLFGLQHSVMARSFFKEGLLRNVSNAVKYATFAWASSICLFLIVCFWQPIEGHVWDFQNGLFFWTLTALYILGWLIAFVATFMIDHFELFGLHQGYRVLKNIPDPDARFQIRFFYNYVRHPIQAGTIIGLWATPSMSFGHLFLSVGLTVYILIGLHFEEKDLLRVFGEKYKAYIDSTPLLIPFSKRR